jgi:hypothetical protein
LDIQPGVKIIIPIGTKYCMTYDTKVLTMPIPVTVIIDTISGNYIHLKNSNVVILLDSLCEQLAAQFINQFDEPTTSINNNVEQPQFKIGQLIFIPKGTFYMTNKECEIEETEFDIQGKIKDISTTYIMLENFDGLIIKSELTKDNILQHNRRDSDIKQKEKTSKAGLFQKTNNGEWKQVSKFTFDKIEEEKQKYNNSDVIRNKRNIWLNIYQQVLNDYYTNNLTDKDITATDKESRLWMEFMEYYHNRQNHNIKEEGLN